MALRAVSGNLGEASGDVRRDGQPANIEAECGAQCVLSFLLCAQPAGPHAFSPWIAVQHWVGWVTDDVPFRTENIHGLYSKFLVMTASCAPDHDENLAIGMFSVLPQKYIYLSPFRTEPHRVSLADTNVPRI